MCPIRKRKTYVCAPARGYTYDDHHHPHDLLISHTHTQIHPTWQTILGILLALSLSLMTGCKYTGSSELLGAFLAGFCFCTDHHVHRVWEKQVKRLLQWMIRVFFACTIGFAIPIKDFWTMGVWLKAIALLACMSGKLAMGLFAIPRTTDMMLTLAFAWGEWGEFSFIIATLAFEGDLIDKEWYSAIILAVSISIIVSPLLLERNLERIAKHAEKAIENAMEETSSGEIGKRHNVFYCLQTRSHARWGQQSNLLTSVIESKCEIIDFRTFHPYHHVGDVHVLNELYLKDMTLELPVGVAPEGEDKTKLENRLEELRSIIRDAIHESDPEIKISRWEPGHVHENALEDDEKQQIEASSKIDDDDDDDKSSVQLSPRTKKVLKEFKSREDHDLHAYRVAHDHLLLKAAQDLRHRRFGKRVFRKAPASLSIAFHDVRPHHELDGFVHVEEHDAFPDFVSDASEEQVHSDDNDEDDEIIEDDMVKDEAGLTRTQLFLSAMQQKRRDRRTNDSIELKRRLSAPAALESPPSSPISSTSRRKKPLGPFMLDKQPGPLRRARSTGDVAIEMAEITPREV